MPFELGIVFKLGGKIFKILGLPDIHKDKFGIMICSVNAMVCVLSFQNISSHLQRLLGFHKQRKEDVASYTYDVEVRPQFSPYSAQITCEDF